MEHGLELQNKKIDHAILLTGASGFVGRALSLRLIELGVKLICAVREPFSLPDAQMEVILDINEKTDWSRCLAGIDTVIHVAARVHVMQEVSGDPLAEFRRVNGAGTLNLAKQAVESGVKRFIFLSSIKVNGEETIDGVKLTEKDIPNPQDAYGVSKYEAELGLFQIAKDTGLEVIIIRPPLVYGPDVKANFASMLRWVHSRVPLPFGAVKNKRSFVYLGNLISLIICCIEHPDAANEIFFVSDGDDLSISELLNACAKALGKRSLLFSVPPVVLMLLASMFGKRATAQRLLGSLQVDISKSKERLGWIPPISVNDGLKETVRRIF
ncbi:SDR family oxidoreductase [Glaciimonas sp. Gout2]|uniref:UDP-glucose 4-epimerase family protein n=1 Tax=Glaciimonas sp. Cout2 TaxID=3048621 RepID=UPI002B228E27|nr:SDR family oxidoreductase [Glaciimonas sp. Cout2]MEB0013783.1 SDR family oxidoreductase [Glaciimonas sp. Cout2]MEB0083114.1 SDR family oxidoreductase [Glaciimonas sp. Gout2]